MQLAIVQQQGGAPPQDSFEHLAELCCGSERLLRTDFKTFVTLWSLKPGQALRQIPESGISDEPPARVQQLLLQLFD